MLQYSTVFFNSVVDQLILDAENDKELADGLVWIDNQAKLEGISFYDKIFDLLYRIDNQDNKRWLQTRN